VRAAAAAAAASSPLTLLGRAGFLPGPLLLHHHHIIVLPLPLRPSPNLSFVFFLVVHSSPLLHRSFLQSFLVHYHLHLLLFFLLLLLLLVLLLLLRQLPTTDRFVFAQKIKKVNVRARA